MGMLFRAEHDTDMARSMCSGTDSDTLNSKQALI
jgi:hypothetical protein